MASFSECPNHVLRLIVEMCHPTAQFSLALSNKRLHDIVNPVLYKQHVRQSGTAVFWAAREGRLDTLELLQTHGAELNDSNGSRLQWVFDWAFPRGDEAIDPFAHDVFFTPLHIAAKFGQCAAVKWLLDHGARLEVASQNFCSCQHGIGPYIYPVDGFDDLRESPLWTPVHTAVCHGHVATARLLLQRGADITGSVYTQFHPYCETVLHAAARKNDGDMIRLLQDGPALDRVPGYEQGWVDIDDVDSMDYSALHLSVMHSGELHALKALHRSLRPCQSLGGDTPYSLAFEAGFFHACAVLHEFLDGYPPECVRDWSDELCSDLPCHYALQPMESFPVQVEIAKAPEDCEIWEERRARYIQQILAHPTLDCKIHEEDRHGRTALNVAIGEASASPQIVQCLLESGADPNHTEPLGFLPLHKVCGYADLELFEACAGLLLQHGARLDLPSGPDESKMTVLEVAVNKALSGLYRDYSIVEFLLKHATTATLKQNHLDGLMPRIRQGGWYHQCHELMRSGGKLPVLGGMAQKWARERKGKEEGNGKE